jgi:hypothetical protein
MQWQKRMTRDSFFKTTQWSSKKIATLSNCNLELPQGSKLKSQKGSWLLTERVQAQVMGIYRNTVT